MSTLTLSSAEERRWAPFRSLFQLRPGVSYLNQGSFGPTPRAVSDVRAEWQRELASQPMDFYVRELDGHLLHAATRLGKFVGASPEDLVFVDNATTGMNLVAASLELEADDEILLTDHEYGAVRRIWQRKCERAGAKLVTAKLPLPLNDAAAVVDQLFASATPKTKLVVVSHITSPTAVILPVAEICRRARELGLHVCIDGPHAIAMAPLQLKDLDCDFYCASTHKWLGGPLGTGFLYVHRRRQQWIEPIVMSWGASVTGGPPTWRDELNWIGTRDPAGFLAIPTAIDFLEAVSWETFRERTHWLAQYARQQITRLTEMESIVPDSPDWYGSMSAMPIPQTGFEQPAPGKRDPWQDALWERWQIEVPIVWWQGTRSIRVSGYLYNQASEIDDLTDALGVLMREAEDAAS